MQAFYINSSSAVMVDGGITESFDVTTRMLQDDVFTPFLFIIVVDHLLGNTCEADSGAVTHPRQSRQYPAKSLNDLDFADDIALLESSIPRAQSQLSRTTDAAADLGLIITAPKTEYMTINCHPKPPLQVYGNSIIHVSDFRYLGSMMASSVSDLKRRKSLACTAFWKLQRLWRYPNIPVSTKVRLFDTTRVAILLYGCELWAIAKAMEDKINAFGTSCYRIMLNIKSIDRLMYPSIT